MRYKSIIMLLIFCLTGMTSAKGTALNDTVVLVGHPGIADSLTAEDVKQIFLGRKTRWSDDTKITFVLLNEEDVMTSFLKDYVRKTLFQYKNYWKKQVFTGKGRMPKAFKNPDSLIEFVSTTEGAISFAFARELPAGDDVKILPVLEP